MPPLPAHRGLALTQCCFSHLERSLWQATFRFSPIPVPNRSRFLGLVENDQIIAVDGHRGDARWQFFGPTPFPFIHGVAVKRN